MSSGDRPYGASQAKAAAWSAPFGFDPFFTPWLTATEIWRIQTEMSASAAEVILRRLLMAATGAMTLEEAARMVLEKPATFSTALEAMAMAFAEGASPQAALRAGSAPLSRRMRANARRLRG